MSNTDRQETIKGSLHICTRHIGNTFRCIYVSTDNKVYMDFSKGIRGQLLDYEEFQKRLGDFRSHGGKLSRRSLIG